MQIRSSDESIIVVEESSCNWDLTLPPPNPQNMLDSGGVVTWLQDYDFHITAANYHINGVAYSSPSADVTLSPADPTLDRFDVIYVDTDGIVKVLEGTPSLVPLQPSLDLGLQVGLGVIFVQAASTEPVNLVQECIDNEILGWTPSVNDVTIDPASANTPCNGLVVAEATNSTNGDILAFTRNTPFSPASNYNVITFQLKPKSDWGTNPLDNHTLKMQLRLAGVNVGPEITISHGTFGFDASNLVCQTVSIPVTTLVIPLTANIDNIRFTVTSDSGTFGWFLDGICLQGGVFSANQGDFIWNQYLGPQTPGRYWIQGDARVEGWITSPQRIGTSPTNFYIGTEKFGWGSFADNNGATVIGAMAQGHGNDGSVAVGCQSYSENGVAVGYFAHAERGIAIGGLQTGSGGVAIGGGSIETGLSGIAIGGNANTSGIGAISLGYYATTSGYGGITIGTSAINSNNFSAAIGVQATTTAQYQMVIGGSDIFTDTGYRSLYFGTGVTSQFNADRFWTITGSQGNNVAGNKWIFAGAKGTGDALSGPFEWQTSDPGASGSTLQSLSTKMGLNSNTKGLYLADIRFEQDRGADVVSANDLILGHDGSGFLVSGSTQINSILNTDWQPGSVIYLLFSGSPTLKHNTVGGAGTLKLQLAGSVDFLAAPGDLISLWNSGSYWHEIGRKVASGGGSGVITVDNALTLSTATNAQWGGTLLHDTTVDGVNTYGTLFDNQTFFHVNTDLDVNLYSTDGSNYSTLELDNTANFATRLETVSPNMTSSIIHNDGISNLAIDSNKSISIASDIRTTIDGRFEEDKGANIVASSDLTLGLDGNLFIVTGNTQINAITTANWQAGSQIILEFTGTPTLKHNTAGGFGTAPLSLSGAVDFTVASGDTLSLVYDGTTWHEVGRKSSSVGGSGILTANNGVRLSTATNVQWGGPVGSQGLLIQNTFIETGGFNVTIGNNLTTSATASNALNFGKNSVINAGTDLNTVFLNSNTVSGNENFVAGRNMVVAGNTNFVAATDGQVFSTANYSATFGDAPQNRGIAALTAGFGNINYAENGFTMGSNNQNGGSTANLYSNSTVLGLQNFSLGSRNIVGGAFLSANNVLGDIILFGKGISIGSPLAATTTSSFNVGWGKNVPDFEITSSKIRINSARFEEYKGADVNSANDLTLGIDGNTFTILGTTQINAITTANWQAGSSIKLLFNTVITVKHNTAGGGGTAPILLAGSADLVTDSNTVLFLVYNGSQWEEVSRKLASVSSGYTVRNGLSEPIVGIGEFGSASVGGAPLLHETYVGDASAYSINFNSGVTGNNATIEVNNAASGNGIYSQVSTGTAITGNATSNGNGGAFISVNGIGLSAISGTNYAALFNGGGGAANGESSIIQVQRSTSGTAGDGIGQRWEFVTQTSDGVLWQSNMFHSIWTTANTLTRTSKFIIDGVNNAITADLFTLQGTGETRLNKYGVGSFTAGTGTYLIATKSDGTLMEFPTGGLPGGGSLITADNGITANTATNVQLGGTLIQTTTIAQGNFKMSWTGTQTSSSDYEFNVTNTGNGGAIGAASTGTGATLSTGNTSSGDGLLASSSSGFGVHATSITGTAGMFRVNPATTNTVVTALQVIRGTSATPANGLGVAIDLKGITDGFSDQTITRLGAKWTDVADATRTGQLDVSVSNSASLNTIMSAYGSGVVGIGISSSYTATRLNVVDNAVTSGSIVDITSTSTGAASNTQKAVNIALSGTNGTSGQTTYGLYSSNAHAGTTSSNYGIYGTSSNGTSLNIGIAGVSSGTGSIGVYGTGANWGGQFISAGVAMDAQNSSGGYAATLSTTAASTNTEVVVQTIARGTSGTAANGIAGSTVMMVETTNGTVEEANRFVWSWTNATHASRVSQLDITGVNNAASQTQASFKGTGQVQFNQYGVGTFTGTEAYRLAVTSTGNIVEKTSIQTKGLFVEFPSSSESVGMWQTPVAITVSNVKAVLVGSSSPSITMNIAFGTDRTSGTNVFTSGQTVTSTTTGHTFSSGFNDATIPAGSFIWFTTSAQSGTVTQIEITLNYTED